MKRIVILFLALAALVSFVGAQESFFPVLQPKNAKAMALGGSFSALPTAEFSFFGNPAAFGARKASLTLASADAWAYVRPNQATIDAAINSIDDPFALIGSVMPGNGIGAGASVGLGYAGRGLGLGVFVTSDNYAAGDSLPEAVLSTDTIVNAVIGLGFSIIDLDGFRLTVGGDIRPLYRIRSDVSLASGIGAVFESSGNMDAVLNEIDVKAGFGVAADLGAALELGGLTVGVSVRDLAPQLELWQGSLGAFLDAVETTGLPKSQEGNASTALFLPNISAGLAYKPRFIPGLIDPSFYVEVADPIGVIKDKKSVTNLLHAGAEVRLLSLVTLRGGVNRGWLSAGLGVKLLFLEANVAVFTEELGKLPGDRPRSGVALQAALRF